MAWFDRHLRLALALIVFGLAALALKQGYAIAHYGFHGWLRGEGPHQSEWEVRAVLGVVFGVAPALVITILALTGTSLAERASTWRLARAIRRSRPSGRRP
jgi:hypothetical protein